MLMIVHPEVVGASCQSPSGLQQHAFLDKASRTHSITPPCEKITKIIRPEYCYVILGGGYGKIT